METLQNIFQAEIIQRLGWTLVHFVWQGIAVSLVLAIVLRLLQKYSANLRYIIACMALALIVVMPAVTIRMIDVSVETIEPIKQAAVDLSRAGADTQAVVEMPQIESPPAQVAVAPRVPLKDRFIEAVEPALPFIVVGWLIGVFGLSLWHLGGWTQLQRLRRQMVKQVTPALKAKLQQLSNMLGIRETVGLVESALVQVPTVVGHLKPVILLPASALTGLSTEQVEAILAHELAHIKRCDYLVNMLQTVVEIFGFYHPAVWWVSHKIRVERENCCDDIAVSLCSDRVCYARALTTMEEIRAGQPALAVAASGGSLLMRIRRLLGKDSTNEGKLSWLPSVIAMLLIAGLLIPTALALSSDKKEQADVKNDRVRVYQVNRKVSDFPETEGFSTPESAYAAINRVMAAEDHKGWQRVSIKSLADRLAKEQQVRKRKIDPEWSKVVLNAHILEVRVKDDEAVVIAQFPQELISKPIKNPIDYRHLSFEDGKWLNTGENRYDTIEQAREKFTQTLEKQSTEAAEQLKIEQKHTEAIEKPEMLLNFTEELFKKIRKADYDKILSYYDKQTGKWKRDGWKKLIPEQHYMTKTNFPGMVKWICENFKENPIVSVELGKVFVSEKDFSWVDRKNWPTVPYKLVLKDGGIIEGNLLFRYMPERKRSMFRTQEAYWMRMLGLDWHLQDEPIKKPDGQDKSLSNEDIVKAFDELVTAVLENNSEELQKIAIRQVEALNFTDAEKQVAVNSLQLDAKALRTYKGIENLEIYTIEKQNGRTNLLTSEVTDGRGVTGRLSFGVFGKNKVILDGFAFVANDGTRLGLRPQVLTSGYILSVPVDLPQLKELLPTNKTDSGTLMITPEKLEEFLKVIDAAPGVKIIAAPKLLANDGEVGKIRAGNAKGFDSIKLNIKNTVGADRKTIRLELDFEYSYSVGQDITSTSVSTTAAVLSEHAIAIAGSIPLNGQMMLLIVKPQVL